MDRNRKNKERCQHFANTIELNKQLIGLSWTPGVCVCVCLASMMWKLEVNRKRKYRALEMEGRVCTHGCTSEVTRAKCPHALTKLEW